jgi:topoisomerase IA-like protein
MEINNIVLGKINKKKVYLNNGKYGHYINHDGKNYKLPEWMPPEKLDLDMAERLIEYKKKMSTQWCEAKAKEESESDSDDNEELVTPKLEIKKKTK